MPWADKGADARARRFTDRELSSRLRETDLKAGHFERKVQALESERDQWVTKFEEMSAKYENSKKEVDDLLREMGSI